MRRFLPSVLAVHWMAVFAMLAVVCAAEPASGISAPLRLLGLASDDGAAAGGAGAAAFFAVAFSVVAVLFFWTFAESLFGMPDGEDRTQHRFRTAFAYAAAVLTMLVAAAAVQPVSGSFIAIECLLAASLVSYLAVCADRWSGWMETEASEAEGRDAARLMALGAAHSSVLPGLGARTDGRGETA